MITPQTGSMIVMALQFGFGVMLLPTVFDSRAAVPRRSSVPTAMGLWVMAWTFYAMGSAWHAAVGTAICAACWTVVAVLRPVRDEGLEHMLERLR